MSHPFSKKIKNNRYVYIGSKCSKSGESPKTHEGFLDPLPTMQKVIFFLSIVINSFLFDCYFDLAGRTAGLR